MEVPRRAKEITRRDRAALHLGKVSSCFDGACTLSIRPWITLLIHFLTNSTVSRVDESEKKKRRSFLPRESVAGHSMKTKQTASSRPVSLANTRNNRSLNIFSCKSDSSRFSRAFVLLPSPSIHSRALAPWQRSFS